MAKRSPVLLGVPLLAVSVVASLAIGEWASRALHLSKTWTSYVAGREMNLAATLTKQSAGFTRIAGTTFPMPFDQVFTINADGFRDREFSRAKRPGAIRVAFLGDSVMEGYAVDAAARLPDVARAMLAAGGHGEYEVMNFGVAGHSTADEYVVLRDHALAYQPDMVVVQMGWNDFADNRRKLPVVEQGEHGAREGDVPAVLTATAPRGGVKGFLQARSAFYLTIAERYGLIRLRRGDSNRLLDRVLATSHDEWSSTARIVNLIVEICRARGIGVVVTYVPLDVEVQAAREQDARFASDRVETMCRTFSDVTFVDAVGPLRARRAEALFVDDAHLTAAGHRILAAEIAAAVSRASVSRLRQSEPRAASR